jgi:hypothetical protein
MLTARALRRSMLVKIDVLNWRFRVALQVTYLLITNDFIHRCVSAERIRRIAP